MEADGGPNPNLVGINTMAPNRLVAEALANDVIPELCGYPSIRREVKYGEASRIDFLLQHPDRPPCWLEIKNCHLMRTPGLAEFPDCVAARSAKHLRELEAMKAKGDRAVMLFVVQRTDCHRFNTAADLDPVYAKGLIRAADAGVEVLIYRCDVRIDRVAITTAMPWC